jgi:hypothetical protein
VLGLVWKSAYRSLGFWIWVLVLTGWIFLLGTLAWFEYVLSIGDSGSWNLHYGISGFADVGAATLNAGALDGGVSGAIIVPTIRHTYK